MLSTEVCTVCMATMLRTEVCTVCMVVVGHAYLVSPGCTREVLQGQPGLHRGAGHPLDV